MHSDGLAATTIEMELFEFINKCETNDSSLSSEASGG